MSLRYLSICSGIEAASVAWEPLGFTAAGFSEIDPFASAVLAARFGSNLPGEPYPGNAPPNFGDFTAIPFDEIGPVDLLVGGTPCQAFSFAGKRLSLADARGNLTLAFAVLAHELARSHGLRNALWENVPGVLSTPDNAFGCFLGAIVGADAPLDLPAGIGRWPDAGMVAGPRARAAWRILDAQYFGLAQRRERVFVVVDFGNGADPAAVLFEPQSLQGNSPPRREAGQKPAPTVAGGARSRGGYSPDDVPLTALAFGGNNTAGPMGRMDFESETFIAGPAHTLRGEGFDASEDGTGRGTPIVPVALRGHSDYGDGLPCLRAEGGDAGGGSEALIAFDARQSDVLIYGDITGPLDTKFPGPAIAFSCKDHGADAADDLAPTLRAMGHGESHANAGGQVAVAFAIQERAVSENPDAGPDGIGVKEGVAYTLEARTTAQGVAYGITADALDRHGEGAGGTAAERSGLGITEELSPTLKAKRPNAVAAGWAVRRLLPHECARLQGFPDHHSRIAWRGKPAELCPDGNQYKTYGNSMAVSVMRWLGQRLLAASGKDQIPGRIQSTPSPETPQQQAQESDAPRRALSRRRTHEG